MKRPVDKSCRALAAEALPKRLHDFRRQLDGVRANEDLECVHRMRVASRRLRSALASFKSCLPGRGRLWRRQVKAITLALGQARDLDVQLEFVGAFARSRAEPAAKAGLERLLLRLRQQRQQAQRQVVEALDKLESSRALESMASALRRMSQSAGPFQSPSRSFGALARRSVLGLLTDLLALARCVEDPQAFEPLHRMRIAAKRLRYAMEVLSPACEGGLAQHVLAAKRLQRLLGEFHDCQVWVDFLPAFLDQERRRTLDYLGHDRPLGKLVAGVQCLRQDRQRQRDLLYQDFRQFWAKLRRDRLWEKLRQRLIAGAGRAEPAGPRPAARPSAARK